MKTPSIRLITPSYQQGQFIEQAIRSVLDQRYPAVTYFVADGGSTDGTVDVLRRLLQDGQWHSARDGGQTACLIEAFASGDEEVLGWVNSDDYLLPETLQLVGEEFARDPELAIVHGDGLLVDEQGMPRTYSASMPIRRSVLEEGNLFVQPSTFFRRRWYERAGGLDRRLTKAFDYDLFVRIVVAGGKCWHVQRPLSAFRIHEGSQTSALWRDFLPECLAIQWRHGDRRRFARRLATKLCLLCHGPMNPWRKAFESDAAAGRESNRCPAQPGSGMTYEATWQYLEQNLDRLLGTGDWRNDAPRDEVERYYRAEANILRLISQDWPKRFQVLARLMTVPELRAMASWCWHVATTGQWLPLWQLWRLARRRGRRHDPALPAVTRKAA